MSKGIKGRGKISSTSRSWEKALKKNGNKTDFIFNPLSILTPGKTRNFFDIWE